MNKDTKRDRMIRSMLDERNGIIEGEYTIITPKALPSASIQ